jgi:hypothetical protein
MVARQQRESGPSCISGAALRALLLLALLVSVGLSQVLADPAGATVTSATTTLGPNQTPGSRADARGTITTMVLNSIQQDQRWKAYVGNVTGTLTLDNPNNFTIYAWDLATITGEVYASRFGNLSWTSVTCAPQSLIVSESNYFSMVQSNPDRLNATFNWTVHKQFQVGSNIIAQNTCNSTVTYINDTRQVPTVNSPFQQVLVQDGNGYLVHMADISDNVQGFDNTTYDFQMIVPENTTGAATSYYFYVELG